MTLPLLTKTGLISSLVAMTVSGMAAPSLAQTAALLGVRSHYARVDGGGHNSSSSSGTNCNRSTSSSNDTRAALRLSVFTPGSSC